MVEIIFVDNAGNFHLGMNNSHIVFDPVKEEIVDTINNTLPRIGMVDDQGKIWAATHDELFICSGDTYEKIYEYPKDGCQLPEGTVFNAIFQDRTGNIWISTLQGISVYYPYKTYFDKFLHHVKNSEYRDYPKILFKDSHHNLWYGTFGSGLLLLDQKLQLQKRFLNDPGQKHTLAANFIWSISEDHSGNIWIGTNNGISVYDAVQKKFIKTINNQVETYSNLTHNLIYNILHDSRENVWIATQEGLDILKPNEQIRNITEQDGVCYYKPSVLMEDNVGNIWIGTFNGLSCFYPEQNEFKNYRYNPESNKGLSNKKVNAIYQDKTGNIWIGTNYGLNKLNPLNDTIEYFFEEDGLIYNRVERIYGDIKNRLWIQTPEGISMMNIKTNKIINFDKKNGLITNYSGMYLEDSILYVGRKETGFYKFNINNIRLNSVEPPVHITDVKVNGHKILHGYPTLKLKEKSKNDLILKYDQSSLEIIFSALNYTAPDKNRYKYTLKGYDDQWNTTNSNNRYAAYNNLNPGDYVFQVIASNNDGVWNNEGDSFSFKILPPWWKTWWAIGGYFLIITGLMYLLYLLMSSSAKIKLQQEKAHIQEEKARIQHEKDEFKLKFFTNISHEFRTPLTLIYGTLEQLFKQSDIPDRLQKKLNILYNHALRMKNLVNQVLELRKLNVGELKLKYNYTDIIPFLRRTYTSFIPLANQHNIQYEFICPYDTFACYYDEEKIETILLNLLSNAFKFTPDKGKITYEVNIQNEIEEQNNKLTKNQITIKITNTGKHISDEQIRKIFERFYQSDDTSGKNEGTGIGLTLSKELVEILNGRISVESKDEGITTFIVDIPVPGEKLNDINENKLLSISHAPTHDMETPDNETLDENIENKGPQIMLVAEDDEEMRAFIVSLFSDKFKIIEAQNGKEGFEKTLKYMPDIVISDIMMPDYDGLAFCKDIKSEEKTNHIPFILLTAKTAEEYKLEGYKTGADDYVIKPFSSELLNARVKNLLSNRALLKEMYRKRYVLNEKTPANATEEMNPVDKFLYKAKALVNENMHKEEYSVSQLAEDLYISRIHLNRKLKNILGISASEFIKTSRLNKAMDLLKTEAKLNISEIAYAVGFKEVSNFSRVFKAYHGKSPSEVDRDKYSLGREEKD